MSPVIHGDRLFFCQDDDLFPALYCIDAGSGEIIWKDDRSDMACCYSHPVICQTDAGVELVVAGTGMLLGYDYNTGERKWAAELFCRNIKTTPVSLDGVLYLSLESKGISYQWRVTADADGDGKITREEIETNKYRLNSDRPIPEAFWAKFKRGDENGDGILEGDEIDEAFLDPSNQGGLLAKDVQQRLGETVDVQAPTDEISDLQSASLIQAVRGGGEGNISESHVIWKHDTKAPDHVVSPLVVDGRMHLIKSGGISSCFDIADGESIWGRKRIGNTSQHLASPVYGDGKIYVTGENGTIVVLNSGPELEVLATNELGETSASTPAIADGRLYVRTRERLYCFALPPK
jgi:outer membrane protein assembly factor BamB